jgi:hypothetical protein
LQEVDKRLAMALQQNVVRLRVALPDPAH